MNHLTSITNAPTNSMYVLLALNGILVYAMVLPYFLSFHCFSIIFINIHEFANEIIFK